MTRARALDALARRAMTRTRWCARRPRPRANARARLERPPPRKRTSMSSRSRKKLPPQRRTRSSPRLPRTPEASFNRWTSRRWSRCSRRGGGWPSSARRRRRRWRHPRRSPIFLRASRETRGARERVRGARPRRSVGKSSPSCSRRRGARGASGRARTRGRFQASWTTFSPQDGGEIRRELGETPALLFDGDVVDLSKAPRDVEDLEDGDVLDLK